MTKTNWILRISSWLVDFSGLLLFIVMVLVNLEVALRYFIGGSLLITDEYSGYMFSWMSLLTFGYALERGHLLRIEFFLGHLKGTARHVSELLAALVGLFVSIICTYACSLLFWSSWVSGTISIQTSATPMWIVQIVLPISMLWLCIVFLNIIYRKFVAIRLGEN